MTYGRVFKSWRGVTPAWTDYTQHAFVRGLRDGTLPAAAFLHYLKQDYVFLIHFSRAWALAVTKAETVAEMRLAADTVNGLINDEIALHIKICADAGIDEATLFATEERAENLAYTRYVLDAGHSGDLLDLLAALAPCVMGYGEIGRALAESK
ncbi:MAG: TenA family protein, partial [Pseudomonadota bacterium]